MDSQSLLMIYLGTGAAHCAAAVEAHSSLIVALFMTGLLGSISHCVGMCGPFVMAQTTCRLESISATDMREFDRVKSGLLLPYHLGRMTTYTFLGALVGGVFGFLPEGRITDYLAAGLLAVAAIGFLGYALPRLGLKLPFAAGQNTAWVRSVEAIAKPLFAKPVGWRGYMLGVVLGFIPCGLVYAALAAAAASGDPLGGMFAMAAFAIGTMPALMGLGIAGGWIASTWRNLTKKLMPVLFAGNAVLLLVLSWGLVNKEASAMLHGAETSHTAQTETQQGVGGPFALIAPDGRIVTDKDYLGKALLVYFGYTYCPDVCPTSLVNIADAYDLLSPEDLAKTATVFISVDPERDTPEALGQYTPHFHKQILGLTGSKAEIDKVVHAYRAKYEKIAGQGAAEYLIDHSAAIYLMDAQGKFVRHFEHTVDPKLLANALHDVIQDIE